MNNSVKIIAEAGVNHNGSVDMALQLVDAAVSAGVDAVKFQTFKAHSVISKIAPKADYQTKHTGDAESQLDMVKKLELNQTEHKKLIDHCLKQNIEFLSTPFDEASLDFLVNDLHVKMLKISSGDLTNAPLLLKASLTQKPLILSTGMGTLGEIEMALGVLAYGYTQFNTRPSIDSFKEAYRSIAGQEALKTRVTLLHCTTEYPAPYCEINLRVMDTLSSAFALPVGYSDHTMGLAIPIAAVARGAVVIEKHFTLDRHLPGPDHSASLEPDELKELVKSIRQVEKALGTSIKVPTNSEIPNISVARKSLVASKPIVLGSLINKDNLTTKRPGTGISPMYYWDFLGKIADKDYAEDDLI
ncbi:MAG: N-acetylneuraminate synthase [Syntrophomonas sp.]